MIDHDMLFADAIDPRTAPHKTIDGGLMETVTISPKFQVVLPRSVRERFDLRPGERIQVISYEGRIELIPVRPARSLRGSLRGMSTTLEREDDRL